MKKIDCGIRMKKMMQVIFLKVSKKNLTKKHFFNNFTGCYCTQIRAIAKHIL